MCVYFGGCVCFITNKIIVNNNNIHHKHVFCVLFCTLCPHRRRIVVTSVGSGDVGSRPPGPDSPLDYTCHCTGFNAYHHHHHRQIMCFFTSCYHQPHQSLHSLEFSKSISLLSFALKQIHRFFFVCYFFSLLLQAIFGALAFTFGFWLFEEKR